MVGYGTSNPFQSLSCTIPSWDSKLSSLKGALSPFVRINAARCGEKDWWRLLFVHSEHRNYSSPPRPTTYYSRFSPHFSTNLSHSWLLPLVSTLQTFCILLRSRTSFASLALDIINRRRVCQLYATAFAFFCPEPRNSSFISII